MEPKRFASVADMLKELKVESVNSVYDKPPAVQKKICFSAEDSLRRRDLATKYLYHPNGESPFVTIAYCDFNDKVVVATVACLGSNQTVSKLTGRAFAAVRLARAVRGIDARDGRYPNAAESFEDGFYIFYKGKSAQAEPSGDLRVPDSVKTYLECALARLGNIVIQWKR